MSLILASNSKSRQNMLLSAGVVFESRPVKVDEEAIRSSLLAESAKPREIADTLAEFKARRCADRNPGQLVLGSDQILAFEGEVFSKPKDREDAALATRASDGKAQHRHDRITLKNNHANIWHTLMADTIENWIELNQGLNNGHVCSTTQTE